MSGLWDMLPEVKEQVYIYIYIYIHTHTHTHTHTDSIKMTVKAERFDESTKG